MASASDKPERRRYRKVQIRMWRDAKFRALSPPPPNAQTLWLRLLTGPETTAIPGVLCSRAVAMADELGWSLEGFREAFAELELAGMARADWEAGIVWLPNGIECNSPENPNVIKGWRTTWEELPESPLMWEVFHGLKRHVARLGDGFRKAFAGFPEPFREPSREPSSNQDQDQDQEQDQEDPPSPPRGDPGPGLTLISEDSEPRTAAKQRTRKLKSKTQGPPVYSPDFERCWAAYPKARPDKPDAWKAWQQWSPLPDPEAVLAGIAAWKLSRQWLEEDGRWIPGMGPFLRGRRWETPPETVRAPGNDPPGPRLFRASEQPR